MFKHVFDVDGDGFVSHADFEQACRKLQIKSDFHSVLHAVRALDTEGKGYLDYTEFSKKLTPGIAERVEGLHLPEVGPGKARIAENIKRTANVNQTVREVHQSFNPDYDTSKLRFLTTKIHI